MEKPMKEIWIESLLKNSLYTSRTKVFQELKKELMKIPSEQISFLCLIIERKIRDSENEK